MSIGRKVARLVRVMGGVQMVLSMAIALSFATLLSTSITWTRTGISLTPYYTQYGEHHYLIRINDFPAEPLYTLFLDSVELGSFDDWPTCWLRPHAD